MAPVDARGTLTEAQLAELEAKLGVPLPPVYRGFLAETNGGYADGETDLVLTAYDFIFEELYSVLGEDPSDLVEVRGSTDTDIPQNWVQIGGGGGGSLYVKTDGADADSVWLVDSDKLTDVDRDDDPAAFFRIADDLYAFFGALEPA